MRYRVNEIFASLQGEGWWAGTPMCFIRLSGCNLSCPWCDTSHEHFKLQTESEVLKSVERTLEGTRVERVCVTGGEPTLSDLAPLARALATRYILHLETNGTRLLSPEEFGFFAWITVSPKFPPGIESLRQRSGNELKLAIWPGVSDKEVQFCMSLEKFQFHCLQPVDDQKLLRNAERCLSLALANGWDVSTQIHKYLGWR